MSDVRTIELQPVQAGDAAFLLALYRTTREAELTLVDWSDAQKDAFVAMQYDAQDRHYRAMYPEAAFDIVIVDGRAAGRFYVDRGRDAISVLDICFSPPHRGQGLGTALLTSLQEEAAGTGRPVRLHVELGNPAGRLYERLGFVVISEQGLYRELEWRALT